MLTSGKRFLTSDRARGTSVAEAEGKAISRTRPLRSPAIAATSSSAASSAASTGVACRASTWPASVSRTLRPTRSTSTVPGALLEPAHHLRDGGLGVAERGGGGGEAALVGDGLHDPESCGVDHGANPITPGYHGDGISTPVMATERGSDEHAEGRPHGAGPSALGSCRRSCRVRQSRPLTRLPGEPEHVVRVEHLDVAAREVRDDRGDLALGAAQAGGVEARLV